MKPWHSPYAMTEAAPFAEGAAHIVRHRSLPEPENLSAVSGYPGKRSPYYSAPRLRISINWSGHPLRTHCPFDVFWVEDCCGDAEVASRSAVIVFNEHTPKDPFPDKLISFPLVRTA